MPWVLLYAAKERGIKEQDDYFEAWSICFFKSPHKSYVPVKTACRLGLETYFRGIYNNCNTFMATIQGLSCLLQLNKSVIVMIQCLLHQQHKAQIINTVILLVHELQQLHYNRHPLQYSVV